MAETDFDPDWCVEPGATLREFLDQHGVTVEQLGGSDTDKRRVQDVLAAKPLTPAHADTLGRLVGATATFWLTLEATFRDAIARGCYWTPHFDRATRPYLPGFGPRCSWVNKHPASVSSSRPVVMLWRDRVARDRADGTRDRLAGAWYRLCEHCAKREGLSPWADQS